MIDRDHPPASALAQAHLASRLLRGEFERCWVAGRRAVPDDMIELALETAERLYHRAIERDANYAAPRLDAAA